MPNYAIGSLKKRKVFQFPKTKYAQVNSPKTAFKIERREEGGTLQGIPVASVEEYRLGVALYKLNLQFEYQYTILGGRRVRGGQVVDFVVYNPWAIPVQVFGEYWHKTTLDAEEMFKLKVIKDYFDRDPVVFWGIELQSQEEADAVVRERLG